MGLFDWLRLTRSNIRVLADSIWLTKQAKLAGIARSVERGLAEAGGPVAILLVAHFRDCLDELRQLAQSRGFDDRRVITAMANDLKDTSASLAAFDESYSIDVIVAERHPLPSHDEAVLEFARQLPCRCRLAHHLSIDDALLHAFAGDWLKDMLKQLGMGEDEAIESRVVTRRIRGAQKKIESQSFGDLPADSADEWLKTNCPELRRKHAD